VRPTSSAAWRLIAAHRAAIGLLAIVAIGGVLRTIGVRFGSPYVYHPDEWVIAKSAMAMVRDGDWNPHQFYYSSFLIDLEAILVAVRHALGGAALVTDQAWLYESEVIPAQFGYVLLGRLMVVVMGTATIVAVFAAARRLAGTPAGLAAAATLAVMPLHVIHSHYLTTDVPVALMCALTLLATLRAATERSGRWWLLAGILAGLAGSTKWNGLAVIGVPLLAWAVTSIDPRHVRGSLRATAPWLSVAGALAGLVVATPAVLFDAGAVVEALRRQATIYSTFDVGDGQGTVGFHAQALIGGVGILLVPCLAGLAILAWRSWRMPAQRVAIVVPAFVLAYLVIASLPRLHYERNLVPILPYMAVGGGVAVALAWSRLLEVSGRRTGPAGGRHPSRSPAWLRILVLGALIVILVLPTITSVSAGLRLRRPDTRDTALGWMLDNLPRRTAIARELGSPQTSLDQFRFRGSYFLWQQDLAWYRDHGVRYLVASSTTYDRFVGRSNEAGDAFYRELFALPEVFRVNAGDDRPGPTIRIFRLDPG